MKLLDHPTLTWGFKAEADPGTAGRAIVYPRGRVLGGSSSINGLIYIRGQPEDFDHWAQLGNRGWGWDDVLPYFKQAENWQGDASELHGSGGFLITQVDFGIGFNLDKLGVWPDAVAHFAMTDRAGRSLTDDRTGGYFPYQVIFGQGQNLRFNEISVEKFLFDKELALKVGFYPMGNDFAVLPYLCNFTNDAL